MGPETGTEMAGTTVHLTSTILEFSFAPDGHTFYAMAISFSRLPIFIVAENQRFRSFRTVLKFFHVGNHRIFKRRGDHLPGSERFSARAIM